jgi:Uma2 family endonuclease
MATVPEPLEQKLVLHGEPWETYLRLLRLFDGRRHLRISYDRGDLEIMTLSPEHEHAKRLIGRLLEALTEELNLALAAYGSMTFKRRRKQKGLEPDECYWIQNEAAVRGMTRFNPRQHPPPDVVVEIDVTHSSVDRMGIYRSLNVPEVWRFVGGQVEFHVLAPSGYRQALNSSAFTGLRSQDLSPFLALRGQVDDNAIVRQFRTWVRGRVAVNWQ